MSKSAASSKSISSAPNPFEIPKDAEIYAFRDKQNELLKKERKELNAKSIYDKTKSIKSFKKLLKEDSDDIQFYNAIKKQEAERALAIHKRGIKRDEMRKLEKEAAAQEQKLIDDEKALEIDAAKFDAFLKENDKNSAEAIKKAEVETRLKLEKIQEIKKLNVQMMVVKSELVKNEDQLHDLRQYRRFLENLTPPEFYDSNKKPRPKYDATDDELDETLLEGEEPLIYFTNPQQLLDIFSELEENNLSLIQSCQETEENLEELKAKIAQTSSKMEEETESLNMQIAALQASVVKEEERAKALEERARMFSASVESGDSQDKLLDSLNHKVEEVYRKCLGDTDGDLSTLQMLTEIENRLEELFQAVELIPADKLEEAEKVVDMLIKMKDKERRQRLREEKLESQRLLQEERVQRALERAKAPVAKKVGKPVVSKSAPIQKKKVKDGEQKTKKKDEGLKLYLTVDDLAYYLS